MGHLLTRRSIAAAFAAVMMAALCCLLMGGPVFAQSAQNAAGSAVVQTTANADQQADPQRAGETQAADTDDVPEGSPLGVQLAAIAVLLVLGVGYFRLLSHPGRRAPVSKDGEQSDGA